MCLNRLIPTSGKVKHRHTYSSHRVIHSDHGYKDAYLIQLSNLVTDLVTACIISIRRPTYTNHSVCGFILYYHTICNGLTHMMHIQLAVHQSNTLLDTQWRPSQAMKKKNGGKPKAGTGPIVIPSSRKQNAPNLFRTWRWMKLNLLKASSGVRGGFWVLHRFTTGSVMASVVPSRKRIAHNTYIYEHNKDTQFNHLQN